jgi:hypothetical protein
MDGEFMSPTPTVFMYYRCLGDIQKNGRAIV